METVYTSSLISRQVARERCSASPDSASGGLLLWPRFHDCTVDVKGSALSEERDGEPFLEEFGFRLDGVEELLGAVSPSWGG